MTHQIPDSTKLELESSHQKLLRCPICKNNLNIETNQMQCVNLQCQTFFPIVNKIPVLINETSSIFSLDEYINIDNTLKKKSKLERTLIKLVPSISKNLKAKANYRKFTQLLLKLNQKPKVLIVGSSVAGEGIEPLISNKSSIEIVETDVAFGDSISLICDAHDLPFADASFDGVVVQAVLEHVVDPYRCVSEINRILKDDGLVYSETPFMQQVHLGKYDFTRFTHLGHRRLFRHFEEIDSGVVCGPGMALAWSYQYFLLSFVKASISRALIKIFARVTSFWLKYFDYFLINKSGAFDAASGYYFIGQKSNSILSDKQLIDLYKGSQLSSF